MEISIGSGSIHYTVVMPKNTMAGCRNWKEELVTDKRGLGLGVKVLSTNGSLSNVGYILLQCSILCFLAYVFDLAKLCF